MMTKIKHLFTVIVAFFLWSLGLTVFVTLSLIFITLSFLIHPKFLWRLAKFTCQLSLMVMGQRLTVIGTFPSPIAGPYLYIFNHTSLLDTLILYAVLPEFTGAIGKAEQFKIPLWGWILKRWGAIPIQRADLHQAIESINQASTTVAKGYSLLISPEGTRSSDGTLQPFKKGPFYIAVHNQTPLVPIVIKGAFSSKNKHSWMIRPGRIELFIATPLTPDLISYESVEVLHEQTSQAFEQMLDHS